VTGVQAYDVTLEASSAKLILRSSGEILLEGAKITVKGSGDIVMKGQNIKQN